MKKITALLAGLVLAVTMAACSTSAETVNHNLDKEAEEFKIVRRISFVNGSTDVELLRIEGKCSIEYETKKIDVTCKVGEKYLRHTLVRSDNVFAVSEQLRASEVDPNHYEFELRPQTVIPNVDLDTDSTSPESQAD